jgi:hypothetical protein
LINGLILTCVVATTQEEDEVVITDDTLDQRACIAVSLGSGVIG